MTWRIGIDSGGTFTDVCLLDEDSGRLEIWKVPSTPGDPSIGIAAGMEESLERMDIAVDRLGFFGHGTTVATNALIEGKGARTGLVTSDGFRDLLEIGRQRRPSLYDTNADKPPVLVARPHRFEVPERLRFDGTELVPLDEAALERAAVALRDADVEAVAVVFLYSFVDPEHERRARSLIESTLPDVFVTASHEIAPEFREYERLSTTVVNACLGPIMRGYLRRLEGRLVDAGLRVAPKLTQSNGGVIGFDIAAASPVRTILSGPSTGVVAAEMIGRAAGYEHIITFDVGGTSSDVALLKDGKCALTGEAEVQGYPIKAPMLDIHTVGAGGGSIAYIDGGGLLKVGPRSAGADPGPVCYGLGNDEPTVTDANVVLGTLNPDSLLGGRMPLRRDLAREALARLGDSLGKDAVGAAQGVVDVLVANMAKAIRVISVRRGHDPRDFVLMAFGGAGPLHAARLATELGIDTVLVPRAPGALCALGLLMTDLRSDYAASRPMRLEAGTEPSMREIFEALERRARTWFDLEGIGQERRALKRTVDVRYAGQNYELPIAMPAREESGGAGSLLDALRARFEAAHRQRYGFVADGAPVELVTLRVEASGAVGIRDLPVEPDRGVSSAHAIIGTRSVHMDGTSGAFDCPVHDRDRLGCGNRIDGPAVVEQMDTTTVIPPGFVASVDSALNLILHRERSR